MGYNAYVRCTCWEQGLTKPCPFPAENVYVDEYSDMLWLKTANSGDVSIADDITFDRWIAEACAHEEMCLANERVGNIAGIGRLRHALSLDPDRKFTTLRSVMPETNDGRIEPDISAICLRELEAFEKIEILTDVVVLTDVASGRILWELTEGGGVFCRVGNDGIRMGADENGIFISLGDGPEQFRSREFRIKWRWRHYVYEDIHSGASCKMDFAMPVQGIGSDLKRSRRIVVSCNRNVREDFTYECAALRKLFETSVRTGRPVIWV